MGLRSVCHQEKRDYSVPVGICGIYVARKAHQNNKRFYDRKAKERHFAADDLVYLYTPAMKPGLTKKFRKYWSGPYKVLRKVSELNYEIISNDDKKQIVHVNRLKKSCNQTL